MLTKLIAKSVGVSKTQKFFLKVRIKKTEFESRTKNLYKIIHISIREIAFQKKK